MLFYLVKKYVSVYVSGRLFSAAINFLIIVFLVRVLSAENYGRYALLFGAGNLLSIVLYRCLSQSMLRFYSAYSKEVEQSTRVISFIFFLLLSMDLVVILLGVGGYFFLRKNLGYLLLVVLFTIMQGHFFVGEALLQAQIKKYFAMAMMAIKAIVNLALVLILISLGWKVYGALSAVIIGLFAVNVAIWWRCWRKIKPRWERTLFSGIFRYGLLSLLIFSVGYFVGYLDRYLLAFLSGLKSSGVYSAAYDITYQGVNMLLFSVVTGIVPLLYRSYEEKDHKKFKLIFSANITLVSSVGFYLCLIAFVFSHSIAHLIYGSKVSVGANVIIPLITVMCFCMSIKAYCLDILFQVRKVLQIILFVFILMLVTNVLFNLYLIPRFHVLGAAAAGVASAVVGLLATFLAARKSYMSMIPWLDLLKLLFCTVLCAVVGVFFFDVRSIPLVVLKFLLLSLSFAVLYVLMNIANTRKSLTGVRR